MQNSIFSTVYRHSSQPLKGTGFSGGKRINPNVQIRSQVSLDGDPSWYVNDLEAKVVTNLVLGNINDNPEDFVGRIRPMYDSYYAIHNAQHWEELAKSSKIKFGDEVEAFLINFLGLAKKREGLDAVHEGVFFDFKTSSSGLLSKDKTKRGKPRKNSFAHLLEHEEKDKEYVLGTLNRNYLISLECTGNLAVCVSNNDFIGQMEISIIRCYGSHAPDTPCTYNWNFLAPFKHKKKDGSPAGGPGRDLKRTLNTDGISARIVLAKVHFPTNPWWKMPDRRKKQFLKRKKRENERHAARIIKLMNKYLEMT